jgi:osmotically-inducible protein OsmY
MRRPLALAAALALTACSQPPPAAPPRSDETRAPTTVLRDALILAAVRSALLVDDPDASTSVGVTVTNGVVTLRGTVTDERVRRRMVEHAQETVHVQAVVDRLRVDPHRQRISDRVADVALAARVQTALSAQLGVQKVSVHVERGVVTLDGTVSDAATKRTMLATARGVRGMRNVVDRIRVGVP